MAIKDKLNDSLPCSTSRCKPQRVLRHTVDLGKMYTRETLGFKNPCFSNNLLGEFCSWVSFTSLNALWASAHKILVTSFWLPVFCAPPLAGCILLILGIGAYPQVRWITTTRIIAGVADVEAGRDGANCEHIGHSMSACLRAPFDCKGAVPAWAFASGPVPAFRSRAEINFRPEAFLQADGNIEMHQAFPCLVTYPRTLQRCGGSILPSSLYCSKIPVMEVYCG